MKIKEIEAKNFRSYSHLKVSLDNYHGLTLLSANNGSGKAQPYSERVMTPSGVTTMGQLKVGDYVYNRFGKPEQVTNIFEKGKLDVYRVTTSDGREVLVNKDHLFTVYDSNGKLNKTLSIEDMLKQGLWKDNPSKHGSIIYRYAIPINEAIEYPTAKINYDPYTIGALLGDGCLVDNHIQISADDKKKFILDKIVANNPCLSGYRRNSEKNYTWAFELSKQQGSYRGTRHTHYLAHNEDLNLPEEVVQYTKDKSIPSELMYGSIKQRYELINGLFDTDGSVTLVKSRSNISLITFSSVNKILVDQVIEILRSLGYLVFVRKNDRRGKKHAGSNYVYKSIEYTIRAKSTWEKECKLFTIPDKLDKVKSSKKTRYKHTDRVKIVGVDKLDYQENMRCIMVDDKEHLYVSGDYVVSHNSSIYFALLYALYGKCPDGTKADEVIKHGTKGGTFTRVSLEINGKDYEVTRYRKDKEYKNKVILTCNGEDITLSTDKETNDKIIDILGFKEDTLLNSLVFSPEQLNTFINATDKTKKAMLEDLTNIAIYRKAHILVKEDLKEAQEGLSKAQEGQQHIIDLGNYQKALEEQWKQNKATLEGQKKKYLDYLSKTDQATLEKEVDSQLGLVDHYKQALLNLNNQIDELGINTTAPHLNEYNQARSLADRKYNVQKHTYSQLQEIFTQLKKVQNTPNAICSLCGNVLDAQHKQVEITNLTKQLQEGKQQYLSQKEEYNQAEDKAQQVKAIVNQEQASAKESLNKLNQLNSQKEKINAQMRQATLALQQAQQRLSQYQEAQTELSRLNQQVIEKPKELATDYHSQLIKAQEQVNRAKDKINELVKLEKIYSDRGVKAQALNQVVPFLNDHLAKALDILTGGEIQASITSQTQTKTGKISNKIDLSVNTPNRGRKLYSELSSGEKRRVGISLNIAFMEYLQTQIGGSNLIVLDELFDNMDPIGIDKALELLSKISSNDMTILVISHSPDLKYSDIFQNVINIDNNNGELEL